MTLLEPLTPSAEICGIVEPLCSKFVVDFANGIDVARDHVRVQKNRTGIFARLSDGFTGQGARRQSEINAHLTNTVDGALTWLNELTESLNLSNQAIIKLRDRVNVIVQNVTTLATYSLESRREIVRLGRCFQQRVDELTERIDRIELGQHADRQLNVVMGKWAAGRFEKFAMAERCFLAMEELRWGAFGDYLESYKDKVSQDLLSMLADRVKTQLDCDLKAHSDYRPAMSVWLKDTTKCRNLADADGALQYLGDWSTQKDHPFVFTISQRPHNMPLTLPILCNAARLSNAISLEIFGE